MKLNNDTPSIRFAGFTDAWEQRKIGSEIQTLPFKPLLATPEVDGKHPIIQQGDSPVLGYSNMLPFSDYRGVVLFGDHTLSLYRPDAPFLVATDGIRIVKSEDENSSFLLYFLERYKPTSEGYKRYFSILVDRIGSKPVTQEEREKIGSFFEKIDNLITLHQRKYDQLVNIKKSMLEKMFPKNGELVPEVRFAGFTDAWEQRKLGELCKKATGGGTPSTSVTEYWNGEVPWFQSSDFKDGIVSVSSSNKHISQAGMQKSAAQLIPERSIAIVARVGFGKLALIPFQYTTSQDVLSLSYLTVSPEYGVYSIYRKLQSELMSVQGTSIKGITKDDLLAKDLTISTNQDEQQKIGALFSKLDTLITLHQRKLERLQNIKKACLEKMFV